MRAPNVAPGVVGGALARAVHRPVTDLERLKRAGFKPIPDGYLLGQWRQETKPSLAWRRADLLIVKAAPGDWRIVDNITKRQCYFTSCANAINIANHLHGVD